MLGALTLLLVCQLIGEIGVRALALPIPGPVVGMAILFAGLLLRGGAPQAVGDTAAGVLRHLSLLFVLAGVGLVVHLRVIAAEWAAISLALVVGTLATIVVTAWLMRALMRDTDAR